MTIASDGPKVAVITGASQGIGAGLADGYRQAGYAVVGVSLSGPPSNEQDYLAIQGDITKAETAQRVVDQALDRFGRIDTLVNNAGIYIEKPFTEYTVDDYLAITAVNLTGFFFMTQQTIPQMVSRGSGHIVKAHGKVFYPVLTSAVGEGGRYDAGILIGGCNPGPGHGRAGRIRHRSYERAVDSLALQKANNNEQARASKGDATAH